MRSQVNWKSAQPTTGLFPTWDHHKSRGPQWIPNQNPEETQKVPKWSHWTTDKTKLIPTKTLWISPKNRPSTIQGIPNWFPNKSQQIPQNGFHPHQKPKKSKKNNKFPNMGKDPHEKHTIFPWISFKLRGCPECHSKNIRLFHPTCCKQSVHKCHRPISCPYKTWVGESPKILKNYARHLGSFIYHRPISRVETKQTFWTICTSKLNGE